MRLFVLRKVILAPFLDRVKFEVRADRPIYMGRCRKGAGVS